MTELERAVRLGRALRDSGVPLGTGRILGFAAAAERVGPEDLYWAGRATLISRREDLALYDAAFATLMGVPPVEPPPPAQTWSRARRGARALEARPASQAAETREDESSAASAEETLRTKSFAACSPDELASLARLMARLRLRAPVRRTRRRRAARDGEPDLRRTLRLAMRTGGEPAVRAWRRRRERRRRLVLVLDVSGSMAAYSRALALFAHAALRTDARWEAYAFGTRLTRLTPALAAGGADAAFARIAAEAGDWDGGTRIGASVKRLLDGEGGRAVRGAVVVILSDGLDVGDPGLLGAQMARMGRLAHRVVWLNPLKENPDYAPLARGMSAAMPHIDVFRSGHNLASLEEIAEVVAGL